MATGYEGGFTRRQELTCTETEMAAYADVVLYENEHIYIKMNSGMIRLKIGDGKTGLLNLPWAKVFDATLDDVEAIVGGFASRVETNTKRIENLEAAVSPEIVTPVTDSTMAYAKTVPKGALPNAAITEIGGMSYVKNGVLVDSKVEAVESVGTNIVKGFNSCWNGNLTTDIDGKIHIIRTHDGGVCFATSEVFYLEANQPYTFRCDRNAVEYLGIVRQQDGLNIDYVYSKSIISVSISGNYFIRCYMANSLTTIGSTASAYIWANKGNIDLPYSSYIRETFPIPGDALDGWGQGVNAQLYNKIVLDPLEGVKKYRQICAKRGYLAGDETRADVLTDGKNETVYILENPVETDVSAYFTSDNRLPVVPGGTITAANEFEHEVPFTVKYMIKGA